MAALALKLPSLLDIRSLECGYNTAIQDAGWASLVEVLPQLSNLACLNVEHHSMSDAAVLLLAAAIGSCPKLTSLDVRCSHYIGGGAEAALRAAWAPIPVTGAYNGRAQSGLRM